MTSGPPSWLDLLRSHTSRFAELLERGDLDAPITACPGWSLHDLADHLGGVHQWAAHAVVTGSPQCQPEPAGAEPGPLAAWYRGHASYLVDVIAERPPDAPAWTMDPENQTTGFWTRRQVHETAMHCWDAEAATGTPRSFEPCLAWDGVLEVATVIYPRQARLGRIGPLPNALSLVALDVPGEICIGLGEPVEIRSSAETLLRLLWHRADPDEEQVSARALHTLSLPLTP